MVNIMDKQQILIVDDEEVNRAILHSMFRNEEQEYELIEAENGQQAIELIEKCSNLVLIMLDLVMPVKDGFGVLEYMKEQELLDRIPVILITSEAVQDSEDKAYSYGAADVIHKPFYPHIVKKRSKNIIELYQNKLNMERRLKEQEEAIRAQEKEIRENNEFMIETLSSVVEARSAALHDIGKIGIPDAILLKPGKLTAEEFEIMKTHTTIGCDILEKTYKNRESDFYRYSYEICRYHHERWDGRGYPDHLAGDQIPISAQIVAVADVYDALVSPRVYKSAYANNIAYDMILNGECGEFSQDVMECFQLAKHDFFNIVEVINMFSFS